jgi:hypothetical protein
MAETWFYVSPVNNAQSGPCSIPELCSMLAQGSIKDVSLSSARIASHCTYDRCALYKLSELISDLGTQRVHL